MIRTIYNSRFRDHKAGKPQLRGSRPGERDVSQRREASARRDGTRRENSTVVHPWMSLPERLAAAQAAMRELAGNTAFQCPMGEAFAAAPPESVAPTPAAQKPKNGPSGVHVVIRKRRLPAGIIPALTSAG